MAAAVQVGLTEMRKEGKERSGETGKEDQRETGETLKQEDHTFRVLWRWSRKGLTVKELTRTAKLALLKNQKHSLVERGFILVFDLRI